MTGEPALVLAAGGVPWRVRVHESGPGAPVRLEVAVVHRTERNDWSFPKGKNEPGEPDEQCALREVEEETGLRCRLGAHLQDSHYPDRLGRPKRVRWWAMEVVSATPRPPDDEVDEVRWLRPDAAFQLLSYDTDREVLRRFLDRDRPAAPEPATVPHP